MFCYCPVAGFHAVSAMLLLAHLSQRLTGELIVWLASVVVVCSLSAFSDISSETTGLIEVKYHVECPWDGGTKVCAQGPGHMTKMATMPIEPVGRLPWNLIYSIGDSSQSYFFQMMTLGWPPPILGQGQICSHRLLYGKKSKLVFFRNYCSLWSENWEMQWAKWVNETTWVFKVKVIPWPWHKVIQIWKLKFVFLINYLAIWNQTSYENF